MFQVDSSTAVAVEPASTPATNPGFFTDGNPALNIPPTVVPAEWFNMVTDELLNLLTAAGIVPVKGNHAQVLPAINALIQAGLQFRYPVPVLFPYSSGSTLVPALSTRVGDTPVSQFGKATAMAVFWPMPVLSTINVAKPVKLRILYTGDTAANNYSMQLGYQVFSSGSLTPASYTNETEVLAAPAAASDVVSYLTAAMVLPANTLVTQGWVNFILSRQPTNSGDTNPGNLQIVNITMEQ